MGSILILLFSFNFFFRENVCLCMFEKFRRVLGARWSLNLAPRGFVRKDACEWRNVRKKFFPMGKLFLLLFPIHVFAHILITYNRNNRNNDYIFCGFRKIIDYVHISCTTYGYRNYKKNIILIQNDSNLIILYI